MIFIFFSILTLTSGRNVPDITCDTNIPSLIFDDFSNNFVSDTPVANVASDSPESGSGFLAIQPQPNLSPISSNVAQLVSIMIFISLSACLLQFIISKINEKIPISIVCFIYGMLVYAIPSVMSGTGTDPLTEGILELRRIDNSVLYFVALPILLYEATQEINWYSFCNFLVGGISLAVVGVIFQVLLLGTFFHFALRAFPGNSINFSFLLASTISSTDPIAVLAVLGGLNAPTKLISIFNGESLINDGSSVLLFQFFYLLCIGNYASYAYYALLLVKLLFVSPLLGIAIAFFITLWISLFRRYHLAQCLAVMSGGYLVYFVAEYAISLSGPLSIVCYGIFIKVYGTIAFDREALEKHNHFVEGVCLVANSAVFMISGAVTVGMVRSLYVREGWGVYLLKLVGVYLALNVARAVMIVAFNPVLKYVRYGVDFREASLLIWGGLRGALVLVLGLRLESDPKINDSISEVIAFYISGSVILILIIQGFTFELLYRCLSPYPMNPFRRVYLRKVMKMIDVESEFRMSGLATHWLFANSRVTSCAAMLVPSLDSIRWNKVGCLQFDLPDIDEVFGRVRERAWEPPFPQTSLPRRCNTVVSCTSSGSSNSIELKLGPTEIDLPDSETEGPDPIFAYTMLKPQAERHDHKFYLRLLEHALSADSSRSNSFIAGVNSPRYVGTGSGEHPPERTDTDGTINLECLSFKETGLQSGEADQEEREGKMYIRKEREGELYIMIFNTLHHYYNELYQCAYIDGSSLLTLTSSLDIATDFALEKLRKRSIAAWANVLSETSKGSWTEYASNVEQMDGFEFEWFVLQSMIDGTHMKRQFRFKKKLFNFASHSRMLSMLETLVAYIDVHQALLDRGGESLRSLLSDRLVASYKKRIALAKEYVATMKERWPEKVGYGLLTMAACMMIRIKKEVVDQQATMGLLLHEDRRKIHEILDEQIYMISTKQEKITKFKSFFRKIAQKFKGAMRRKSIQVI